MIVRCNPELFEMFPGASIHGVVFDNVDNFRAEHEEYWRQEALKSVRDSGISPALIVESPEISEWRTAFHSFGVKPSKYRSSIEQLYRRALRGDIIQTKTPLVNLYCYVSIIQMVPMGGYDLRKVQGDISVRMTRQEDEFSAIGEDHPIRCEPGVVVYADEAGVICWAWNHRDGARTCLNADSNKTIFFADSAVHESRGRAAAGISLLSKALSSVGASEIASFVLEQQRNEAILPL